MVVKVKDEVMDDLEDSNTSSMLTALNAKPPLLLRVPSAPTSNHAAITEGLAFRAKVSVDTEQKREQKRKLFSH